MVPIKTDLAHRSNYGAQRSTASIKYIVIHYTGNDGDHDEANATYFKTANKNASAHYFVDDDSITISVTDDYIAYSVGSTAKYTDCSVTGGGTMYGIVTNTNSLSIEMCDTVKNGKYDVSAKTLANTYELVASKMKQYNVDINHVVRHFDVNGKHCPSYYMDNTSWATFKAGLLKVYNATTTTSTTTTSTSSSATEYTYAQFVKDVQKAIGVTVDGIAGPKTLAATPTVSKSKNSKHPVVKPLQQYLNALGFDCGTVDGIAGIKFDAAVKKYQSWMKTPDGELTAKGTTWQKLLNYTPTTTTATVPTSSITSLTYTYAQFVKDVQKAIGVTVDGIAGPKTLAATPTVSKSKNSKHPVVKPLQQYLNAQGYDCGTADGIAGIRFDAAVKKYQSWMKTPDGELTAKGTTWKKLLNLA